MAANHKRGGSSEDAAAATLANPRHDVRMDGVYFFRAFLPRVFNKALDAGNYSYCFMVRSGRLKLEIDFPSPAHVSLEAGDIVAVSGLAAHAFLPLKSAPANETTAFERGSMAVARERSPIELIIGVVPNEALALGSLVLGPILIRKKTNADLARRVWLAVEMLEDEFARGEAPDRALVVRRLAEIMLINLTRRVIAERGVVPAAEIRSGESSRIVRAIGTFLGSPQKAWTLAELAKIAGMSRTRFAEEFRLITGQTPVRIMTRIRLTALARRLANAKMSVEAAAGEAGYGSAAAFVRAFQREFGETPARWRRRQLARDRDVRPAFGRRPRAPRRKERS